MITELVNFNANESTTDDQLKSTTDKLINEFWAKQDIFIDARLVKNVKDNAYCFIYNFQSMDGLNTAGEKMRSSSEFKEFVQLVDPASIEVKFYEQV